MLKKKGVSELTAVQKNKRVFVEGVLSAMLKEAYGYSNKIADITYEALENGTEVVYVELEPYTESSIGRIIKVNVTGDSLAAIVTDVVRKMNDEY